MGQEANGWLPKFVTGNLLNRWTRHASLLTGSTLLYIVPNLLSDLQSSCLMVDHGKSIFSQWALDWHTTAQGRHLYYWVPTISLILFQPILLLNNLSPSFLFFSCPTSWTFTPSKRIYLPLSLPLQMQKFHSLEFFHHSRHLLTAVSIILWLVRIIFLSLSCIFHKLPWYYSQRAPSVRSCPFISPSSSTLSAFVFYFYLNILSLLLLVSKLLAKSQRQQQHSFNCWIAPWIISQSPWLNYSLQSWTTMSHNLIQSYPPWIYTPSHIFIHEKMLLMPMKMYHLIYIMVIYS